MAILYKQTILISQIIFLSLKLFSNSNPSTQGTLGKKRQKSLRIKGDGGKQGLLTDMIKAHINSEGWMQQAQGLQICNRSSAYKIHEFVNE